MGRYGFVSGVTVKSDIFTMGPKSKSLIYFLHTFIYYLAPVNYNYYAGFRQNGDEYKVA